MVTISIDAHKLCDECDALQKMIVELGKGPEEHQSQYLGALLFWAREHERIFHLSIPIINAHELIGDWTIKTQVHKRSL